MIEREDGGMAIEDLTRTPLFLLSQERKMKKR